MNFYWSSNIFTLISNIVETFPISSLEAMASGLPCVLTNVGGAKNIIKDNNGIIVEPENIDSISDGWEECLKMINKSKSIEIREHIVTNYSIKNSAYKYL
jgi:glycosyltransferase involved in cell wall biosynthesis